MACSREPVGAAARRSDDVKSPVLPMVSSTPSNRESTVLVLARGAVMGIATAVALQLSSDPDLWGHLRYGQDWLSTLTVPSSDVYSFTSDRRWINHEWLTEALFAFAYRFGGTIAFAILNAAIVLAALAITRWSARRAGVAGWRLEVLCLAAPGTASGWRLCQRTRAHRRARMGRGVAHLVDLVSHHQPSGMRGLAVCRRADHSSSTNRRPRFSGRMRRDYVWLPKSLPVSAMIANWGWMPIFETETSTVWARSHLRRSWRPPPPVTSSCFPAA
jgi:hypothetical protein